MLALRGFLKTDYRGLEALRSDWSGLRDAPGFFPLTAPRRRRPRGGRRRRLNVLGSVR